jgi:hypothetical protein
VAYKSVGTYLTGATTTNCNMAVGGTGAVDDIACIFLYIETAVGAGVTFPAGFTTVVDLATSAGSRGRLLIAWKRLTGADTGTYTITHASAWREGFCALWSGRVTTGSPIDVTPATIENGATGTSIIVPSQTPVTAGVDLASAVTNFDGHTLPGTFPSGFTSRNYSNGRDIMLGTRDNQPASATGTQTYSALNSSWLKAATIALKPAAGGGTNYTGTPADPVGITDSATDVMTMDRQSDDPVGITDSATDVVTADRQLADPEAITDTVTSQIGYGQAVADPEGITDSVTSVTQSARTQDDPLGITDSVASALGVTRTQADPVGITDSVTWVMDVVRVINDAVGVTDLATYTLSGTGTASVSDPEAITDVASAEQANVRSQADPEGITDSATAQQAGVRGPADPEGITDSATAQQSGVRGPADPENITDTASAAQGVVRQSDDPVGITDSVSAVITSGSGTDYIANITDGVGLTDAAVKAQAIVRALAETVAGSDQALTGRQIFSVIADTVGATDALTQARQINRAVIDQLAITDEVDSGGLAPQYEDPRATLLPNLTRAELDTNEHRAILAPNRHTADLDPNPFHAYLEGRPVRIYKGDLEPDIHLRLRDGNASVDLTLASSISVLGVRDGVVIFTRAATGDVDGNVIVSLQAPDSAVVGPIDVIVRVIWPGNRPQTFDPQADIVVLPTFP